MSLMSLMSLTSLNSSIYHLNQRTYFRKKGADLAYHEKFLVRSAKIWQQVEIALEGGVPKCTSPFRAMSVGAKVGAYHEKEISC